MASNIPEIAGNPKAAFESFIHELETHFYPWYDHAATRDYYAWFVAQALSLVSGFGTAVLAALLREEQFKSWSPGHVPLVVLPLLGSLASTFCTPSSVRATESSGVMVGAVGIENCIQFHKS
jgi:hypothetical protein